MAYIDVHEFLCLRARTISFPSLAILTEHDSSADLDLTSNRYAREASQRCPLAHGRVVEQHRSPSVAGRTIRRPICSSQVQPHHYYRGRLTRHLLQNTNLSEVANIQETFCQCNLPMDEAVQRTIQTEEHGNTHNLRTRHSAYSSPISAFDALRVVSCAHANWLSNFLEPIQLSSRCPDWESETMPRRSKRNRQLCTMCRD